MRGNPATKELVEIARDHDVTLLFSARDRERNNAVVLREFLEQEIKQKE